MEYNGFEFNVFVRKNGKRYRGFPYSGRAVVMKSTKDNKILWNSWESSQSYFSIGVSYEEAYKEAIKLTKKWIDEYLKED